MTLCEKARALFHPAPTLQLLKNVSGEARAGDLVGMLGPSGSGKSTLLSILANSAAETGGSPRISGRVEFNGVSREEICQTGKVAFVPQNDFLLPTLTVRETIWYSAQLRCQCSAAVEERVIAVMEELGLMEVAESQVGGMSGIRGISGGERRRVSIAMEMVTQATVLLLDEPSSGLDSFTAGNLLLALKQIALGGKIVILSIHQPSPYMFSLLDKCFLLCQGQIAYSGTPSDAANFFLSAGLPVFENKSVAEHMVSVVMDPGLRNCLLEFVAQNGPELGGTESRRRRKSMASRSDASEGSLLKSRRQGPSLCTEIAILSWRTMVDIWRNPTLLMLHVGIAALMGISGGGIFMGLKKDVAGLQGRLGAMFFTLCLSALTSLTTVDLMTNERTLVVREVQAGYYRPMTYYLAKALLDGVLLRVLPCLVFGMPLYLMAGFKHELSHAAFFFCLTSVFAATIGGMSMAITVGFNSAGKSALFMNISLLLQLLYAGYFKDVSTIPAVIRWLQWTSPFYYAFQALIANEIAGITFSLSSGSGPGVMLSGSTFLSSLHSSTKSLAMLAALLDLLYAANVATGVLLLYTFMPRAPRLRST